MTSEKPPRSQACKCPDCGIDWLYTDYYDKCYSCGRGVLNIKVDDQNVKVIDAKP